MKPVRSRPYDKGALEILEEATHLLRLAPAATLLCYYLGGLPWVLGLLFFWADMSGSGTAPSHLIQASFGMAVLFLWMQCWQAVFVSRLHALLLDVSPPRWGMRRILRLTGVQLAVMPWKSLVLPLAALVTLPFGWCYAFFHNITVLGNGELDLKTSLQKAWHQSTLWPGQNHMLLFFITLFALFVFMNLCIAAYLLPQMLNTLLGMETIFSRSLGFLSDTTFWLAMAGLTYLCVNPLAKAAYVLRCYYGESLYTGQDLLAELRRLRNPTRRALVVLVAGAALCVPVPGISNTAHETAVPHHGPAPAGDRVSAEQLDSAITHVIEKLEYTWRLPQDKSEKPKGATEGFWSQVWQTIGQWLGQLWKRLKAAVEWLLEWLEKLAPASEEQAPSGGSGFGSVKLWLGLLSAVLLAAAGVLLWKHRQHKESTRKSSLSEGPPVPATPDLSAEDVVADALPAARWLTLARDLLAQGELRLALRALYLAELVHLAEKNLLAIARFKSNRDYERELRRRAHAVPGLVHCFSENVTILERTWYGRHELDRDTMDRFLANQKRIMADAQDR
jgi:hypothetical protein